MAARTLALHRGGDERFVRDVTSMRHGAPSPASTFLAGSRTIAVDADAIQLLRNGAEAFPAWLEAIRAAEHEVLLEMYWFESDHIGRMFADALSERARAGVQVFLIYDAVGSWLADRRMFSAMVEAGVVVREYHPVAPWRARFEWGLITQRDHRKILACDGRVAFTGGINLCDQELPTEQGGGNWRDDAVRVEGPAARELRTLFFDTWYRLKGPRPRENVSSFGRARKQLVAAAKAQAGQTASLTPPPLLARITTPPDVALAALHERTLLRAPTIQVFGHAAWGAERTIRNLYVRHIRTATDCVLIANAYFVPDNAVRRALERAARRGVEVRVMIPRDSDITWIAWASQALYARLMRAGVHIHEWTDGMLHAKTAVIDGWATIGSYNLDYRSLRYNLEVNVASRDPAFVEQMEGSFRADLARCEEIDPVAWKRRPWRRRVFEWLARILRKLM